MFESLCKAREDDRKPFGDRWCGPDVIPRDWGLIARYPKLPNGDGSDCEVYCSAMPARFYKVVVKTGNNSVGEPNATYELTTGSSQAELAATIATAISEGMLSVGNYKEGG